MSPTGAIQRLAGLLAVVGLAIVVGLGGARLLDQSPAASDEPLPTPSDGSLQAEPSGQAPSASPPSPSESGADPTPSPSDLPPVPEDVAELAWVAFDGQAYVAGTLGAGATLTLPQGEIGLDAREGRVLSTDADLRSRLVVRDLFSGAVVSDQETSLTVDNGRVGVDQLFVSARTSDGSLDAGVWRGAPTGGELTQVLSAVAGGPTAAETRAWIRRSPSGDTIGSTVCTSETPCTTQVLAGEGPPLTLDDFYIRWLSDEVVVLWQGSELRALSVSDGSHLWTLSEETAEYDDAYFLADGATLVLGWLHGIGQDRMYELAAINSLTGELVVIATFSGDDAAGRWLEGGLSSDGHATFLSEPLSGSAVRGGARLWTVALADGTVREHQSPFAGAAE